MKKLLEAMNEGEINPLDLVGAIIVSVEAHELNKITLVVGIGPKRYTWTLKFNNIDFDEYYKKSVDVALDNNETLIKDMFKGAWTLKRDESSVKHMNNGSLDFKNNYNFGVSQKDINNSINDKINKQIANQSNIGSSVMDNISNEITKRALGVTHCGKKYIPCKKTHK